jgi:hypothetical protein
VLQAFVKWRGPVGFQNPRADLTRDASARGLQSWIFVNATLSERALPQQNTRM